MTTTTPKSPVDTIREYLLDRKSALDASLKYVMPYNVQKLIEDEFLRVCELLTALSSLSTQPSQTEGLEELAREWVRKTYGLTLAANSSISFDTSEFVKLVAAFARSLPRQKGEVVEGAEKEKP